MSRQNFLGQYILQFSTQYLDMQFKYGAMQESDNQINRKTLRKSY